MVSMSDFQRSRFDPPLAVAGGKSWFGCARQRLELV